MARYIDVDALIAEYDRVHVGPAGGARKLMVDAPTADVAPKDDMANFKSNAKREAENYKKLFNQLLDDFTHAMHYAGKNNNVCNFCEHDCGEGGMCKGRENRIHCHPKWRGLVNVGEDAELEKKYTEEKEL